MEKLFYVFAAMAALLTSCSKDDAPINVPFGDEKIVSFEVSSPELATRYGEGNEATIVEYWVYEVPASTGVFVTSPTLVPNLYGSEILQGKKATVNIKLIQGRKYNVLFWAHAPGVSDTEGSSSGIGASTAVYHVNPATATMEVDYTNMKANQESYDAFYNYYEVGEVTSSTNGGTVYLKRPFAQVNVATSDTEDALKADLDVQYTGITAYNIFTKLDFKNGSASNAKDITFEVTAKATGVFTYNNVEYDIISMNYLLVNSVKDKALVDLTLQLQESTTAGAEVLTRDYAKVSVNRNHRTYILGDIYTQPAKFNVVISEGFDDNHYDYE